MTERILVPEILDSLDPADPAAVRSRADLRRLDCFLGGTRWIVGALGRAGLPDGAEIVELGGGDGRLCGRLARAFPDHRVTGIDLVPRPDGLPDAVGWETGDLFDSEVLPSAGVVVGNLILHHFDEGRLGHLGRLIAGARVLAFCEPWRDPLPLMFSTLGFPFVGPVTRHDMPASIRAGFREGELASALGLRAQDWKIVESSRWRGVICMVACRG